MVVSCGSTISSPPDAVTGNAASLACSIPDESNQNDSVSHNLLVTETEPQVLAPSYDGRYSSTPTDDE